MCGGATAPFADFLSRLGRVRRHARYHAPDAVAASGTIGNDKTAVRCTNACPVSGLPALRAWSTSVLYRTYCFTAVR